MELMRELHRLYGLCGIALSEYGMEDDIARVASGVKNLNVNFVSE